MLLHMQLFVWEMELPRYIRDQIFQRARTWLHVIVTLLVHAAIAIHWQCSAAAQCCMAGLRSKVALIARRSRTWHETACRAVLSGREAGWTSGGKSVSNYLGRGLLIAHICSRAKACYALRLRTRLGRRYTDRRSVFPLAQPCIIIRPTLRWAEMHGCWHELIRI